ncbi:MULTISPECIES: phosphotransferase system, HPr-related protein [unclassified Pseudomonas]|uniref:phosphotransferase system, HPr-related protein n=1 Tax=unclassified Pseudomonas TaxID=196821 RepID=UPI00244C6ECA|nr:MULTISPECIES: phosphotransferase system, HPr-related protein [unclassified Pseudomonas]MDG9924219.1 phosphotransferase system, HPr-related protein [Pseudomonas sp. GD04045]MDH0036649.1 phosphotransferase system, HPr-related protein [Pseudomonas sp. GD04019]
MSKHTPRVHELDDIEDRMDSVRELDFDDRHDERGGRIGDERPGETYSAEREAHAGMTGGETLTDSAHEDNVTMDDLSPDTLFDESGANSPDELGHSHPLDKELSVVDGSAIGGGIGLDEAELARSAPLDGKPWTDQVIEGEDEE